MKQLLTQLYKQDLQIKSLQEENKRLQKSFMLFFEACVTENGTLIRQKSLLETALYNEEKSFRTQIGALLCSRLNRWHAPFSLLMQIVRLWFKEIYSRAPRSLGGADYHKVISTYKAGGFQEVAKLLARKNYSPQIKANAYTNLARNLIIKKDFLGAAEASKKAYDCEPKYFRLKWHGYRLYQAGKVNEADAILNYLHGKVPFSDSEEKLREEIKRRAEIEGELSSRSAFFNVIEQSMEGVLKIDWARARNLDYLKKSNANFLELCDKEGWQACCRAIQEKFADNPNLIPLKFLQLSRLTDKEADSYSLAREAINLEPTKDNLRAFFWIAQNAHRYLEAWDILEQYEETLAEDGSAQELREKMLESEAAQLTLLSLARKAQPKADRDFIRKRVCYILHNSLPWSSGGYATRSHGVAKGLTKQGYEVICLTRPGYPWDIVTKANALLEEVVDSIRYMRLPEPIRRGCSAQEYMRLAADVLSEKLRELKPETVIAASNYITGLPALIAARRLGINFIYEVRGLWEITRLSREEDFASSHAFHIQKLLEAELCKEADHVLAITGGLKKELVERGVTPEHISIVPNACDPEKFQPQQRDGELAEHLGIPGDVPVIGYIGTFTNYEGLELLAEACSELRKKGHKFRLLMVGSENASLNQDGPISAEIRRIAREGNFLDWLIMPGRVPHAEVSKYYSLVDIAPFPRRPWPVCEIVSPMKPLEAMAMGKAVLVSSVNALAEIIRDGETGLIFAKGDKKDLAEKLERMLLSLEQRKQLGEQGRNFIINERNWERASYLLSREINNIRVKKGFDRGIRKESDKKSAEIGKFVIF